jgi:hypothetical protein
MGMRWASPLQQVIRSFRIQTSVLVIAHGLRHRTHPRAPRWQAS